MHESLVPRHRRVRDANTLHMRPSPFHPGALSVSAAFRVIRGVPFSAPSASSRESVA